MIFFNSNSSFYFSQLCLIFVNYSFLLFSICIVYLFPFVYPQSFCVPIVLVYLLSIDALGRFFIIQMLIFLF